MQQSKRLPSEIEVHVKSQLKSKGYNTKQEEDWFRYFKESYFKNEDKDKASAIADIRFNHKYLFNEQYQRYTLKKDYIQRKINKVNK